jgi:hypothetical protein
VLLTPGSERHVTTADARSTFRRWRRTRPFWGGLFLLLAALALFLSANLTLRDLQVHFGQEGYLSYLLPAVLVLCGALTWATPAHRLFYGILGLLTALYSFLGLNLGGFGVGMLLGIVGGALTIAWGPPRGSTAGAAPAGGADTAAPADVPDRDGVVPGFDQHPEDPPGRPGGAHRKTLVITIVPLAVTAVLAGGRSAAHADWCPDGLPSRPAAATGRETTRSAPPSAKPPGTPRSPAETPRPSTAAPAPSPDTGGKPVADGWNRFVQGVGRILGIGGAAPGTAPSPAPTAPTAGPTPSPSPTSGTPGRLAPERSDSGTPGAVPCLGPRVLGKRASPRGVPAVAVRGALLEGRSLQMYDSRYDGTVALPTAGGPLRTLKFSMSKSVTKPFSLTVPEPVGHTTVIHSDALTTAGNVTFYTPDFRGKLFGVIPVTFTPDSPPPLTLPYLWFTDVRITLAYVSCDRLTADPLALSERA